MIAVVVCWYTYHHPHVPLHPHVLLHHTDSVLFFEVRHYKPKEKKVSTAAWSFLRAADYLEFSDMTPRLKVWVMGVGGGSGWGRGVCVRVWTEGVCVGLWTGWGESVDRGMSESVDRGCVQVWMGCECTQILMPHHPHHPSLSRLSWVRCCCHCIKSLSMPVCKSSNG